MCTAINCALCTVRCALLLTVHFALCTLHCALNTALCTVNCALSSTVHCYQMKTNCREIQPGSQHCCSADARSTYKLLFFLLFFQGNTWAVCMLIVPRSSCKATIISLVLTILVAIAVLRYFSLIENMSFSALAILGGYLPCQVHNYFF